MFQFRRFPSCTYGFSAGYRSMSFGEFPHSEIPGSKDVCSSPRLIAAYHVFHRLLVPRHSPCALYSLTVSCSRFSICQQEIFTAGEIIDSIILLGNSNFRCCKSLISQFFIQFSRYIPYKGLLATHTGATSGGLKWTRTIDLSVISRVL